MKVLMLNPSFSGGGYMHNLCNALVDAGHQVDLYTGPHFERSARNWARVAYRPRIRFYRWTQIRSYSAGPLRPLWRLLRFLGHLWAMGRVALDASRYDVVHVHFLTIPAIDRWWLRLIARRAPVVYTVHNVLPHDAVRTSMLVELYRTIYHTAHHLIGHTHETVRAVETDFGVPAGRIARVPMGNANHLRDLRNTIPATALGLDPVGPPILLLLGAIRRNKGLDVLLRAAALLRDRGHDFRVVVAGVVDTDMTDYYELIAQLGLEHLVVLHLGYIEEEAVPTYFRAAAVVTLPYTQIDQSLVAVSAISLGRPIVATRLAGLRELVEDGDCGILVAAEDPVDTARGIELLLADPALRQRLAENARRFADQDLGWEQLAALTTEAFRQAQARFADATTPPSGS